MKPWSAPSLLTCILLLTACLAACQTAPAKTVVAPAAAQPATDAPAQPSATANATRAIPTSAPYATPTFSPAILAYLQPADKLAGSGSLRLDYQGNAQVELIDSAGQRVLVDVFDAERISAPAVAADVLLTTHSHPDHIQSTFLRDFPGQQLKMTPGSLALDGIAIRGLPAAHNDGDTIRDNGSSNILFVIDIAGLRVAHLGDLGQSELTPEQLAALGPVDVAIMQLSNSYSSMSLANKKGFNLLAQIQPKVIIPTHLDKETAAYAVETWQATYSEAPLTLSAETLPAETWIVFMGKATIYGEEFKLQPVDWVK